MRLFGTQARHVLYQLLVVAFVAALAAAEVAFVELLAQLALRRVGQKGQHARLVEREHIAALARLLGLFGCGRLHALGQIGHLLLVEQKFEVARLGQQVVAETYRECGQLRVDLFEARLVGCIEQRAGTHEIAARLLQKTHLQLVQPQCRTTRVHILDVCEKRVVEQYVVVVCRELGHYLGLDALYLLVGIGRRHHREYQRYLR